MMYIYIYIQKLGSKTRDPNLRAERFESLLFKFQARAKAEGEVVVDDTTSSWHTVRLKRFKRLKETG